MCRNVSLMSSKEEDVHVDVEVQLIYRHVSQPFQYKSKTTGEIISKERISACITMHTDIPAIESDHYYFLSLCHVVDDDHQWQQSVRIHFASERDMKRWFARVQAMKKPVIYRIIRDDNRYISIDNKLIVNNGWSNNDRHERTFYHFVVDRLDPRQDFYVRDDADPDANPLIFRSSRYGRLRELLAVPSYSRLEIDHTEKMNPALML